MAVGEIVSGLVGASIGSVATFYSPILLERFRTKKEDRKLASAFVAQMRSDSRAVLSELDRVMAWADSGSPYDRLDLSELGQTINRLGGHCHHVSGSIRYSKAGLDEKIRDYYRLSDSILRVLIDWQKRRVLLAGSSREAYDADCKSAVAAKLDELHEARSQIKDRLRREAKHAGIRFPEGV